MLDRLDAAHGKTVSVAGTIDVVDDRCLDVARAQEIRMQRVRGPLGIGRLLRRRKRLAKHLAAEHVAGADVAALAAEQVVFQAFELPVRSVRRRAVGSWRKDARKKDAEL